MPTKAEMIVAMEEMQTLVLHQAAQLKELGDRVWALERVAPLLPRRVISERSSFPWKVKQVLRQIRVHQLVLELIRALPSMPRREGGVSLSDIERVLPGMSQRTSRDVLLAALSVGLFTGADEFRTGPAPRPVVIYKTVPESAHEAIARTLGRRIEMLTERGKPNE